MANAYFKTVCICKAKKGDWVGGVITRGRHQKNVGTKNTRRCQEMPTKKTFERGNEVSSAKGNYVIGLDK